MITIPVTRYITTSSTQPIGSSPELELPLELLVESCTPVSAIKPPKTPTEMSAPIPIKIGNAASVRSLTQDAPRQLAEVPRPLDPPHLLPRVSRPLRFRLPMMPRNDGDATRIWRAPGRVNLIGDHTDYQAGFCLPMAIDRECRVTVRTSADSATNEIRARSAQLPGEVVVTSDGSTDPRVVEPAWGRFLAGVVHVLSARGACLPAAELDITSTVPAGSGLSSSSALTVALTVAFAELAELPLDRTELAELALAAEVAATGVPGGLMDQLAAVYAQPGHALLLDCRTLTVDPIAIPRSIGVVVVHSGEPRTLAGSAYAERRAACEAAAARIGVPTLRDASLQQVRNDPRARHVVTENARVLEFAAALRAGDTGALGPLMLASHASLRDDFEVSTPTLDRVVAACMEHGALGARLTGAGFGGCVVALVQRNHADDLLAKVARTLSAPGASDVGPAPLAFAVRPGEPAGPVTSARATPTSSLRTLPV